MEMNTDAVKMKFANGFVGTLTSPTGQVKLGHQTDGMTPYQLLYGALGSCFYATFLSVASKMRLSFDDAEIEITGNKRDETPATLDYVKMELVVHNPSDEIKLRKAAELGAHHCSIHATIEKVAKIDLEIIFKNK